MPASEEKFRIGGAENVAERA